MTAAEIAKMEEEMIGLERDYKAVEEGYGDDMLNLGMRPVVCEKVAGEWEGRAFFERESFGDFDGV